MRPPKRNLALRRGGPSPRAQAIALIVLGLTALGAGRWLHPEPRPAQVQIANVGIPEQDLAKVCANQSSRNSCSIDRVVSTYGLDPQADALFISALKRNLADRRSFDPAAGLPVPVDLVEPKDSD